VRLTADLRVTGQVQRQLVGFGFGIRCDRLHIPSLKDNGSTPSGAPAEFRGGSNLPFRGESGSALEGSLRVPCMVRGPGKIAPRVRNEMVSIHDIFPTLAKIIGAKVPEDRPIDGVDQSEFFTGEQPQSNRDSLLTFIGDELAAVRWHEFRLYPKRFVSSAMHMQGLGGYREEGNGFPAIFNIEADPREEVNTLATNAWVINQYLRLIGEYQKSLEKYPNPKAVNLTEFGK